jgi:hypothetical protein
VPAAFCVTAVSIAETNGDTAADATKPANASPASLGINVEPDTRFGAASTGAIEPKMTTPIRKRGTFNPADPVSTAL